MTENGQHPPNHFTFQIKNPSSSKNKINPNMVAMKRIQNYSYALNDEIGLGFTSHVYKGKCQLTNKQVAVKVIQLKNNEDQLHANFLKQEVAVLETIKGADSKNLLKLEKVIKSKNNLYIITQFCEGNDVAKILRKKKNFTENIAQSIMKQLLNGYKQLFKLGIVHRDLKPSNLFVTRGQVKIADFGFAVSQQQCKMKINYNVGSPFYMPPESLKQNEYSHLSDVWSIGIIAYQLMYGRVPWKDKSDQILYEMIMNCPIQKLFDSDKEVSQHYKKFIKACLTIDRRYRAVPEFIINYQWPLASQYVQGLQNPNNYRYSLAQGLPSLSLEKPELIKPISQQNNMLRKRAPSFDHLTLNSTLGQQNAVIPNTAKNININMNYPLQQISQQVTKSFIQQEKQKNSQKKTQRTLIKAEVEKYFIEQLNYCRFLAELYHIVERNLPRTDPFINLMAEFALKIYEKMKNLLKSAQNQENCFKLPGFIQYCSTERWQALRQVIYKYDLKFRQKINYNSISERISQNDYLVSIIRDMKIGLPQNLKLVQLLTYYYQLREQEIKGTFESFQQKMRISYLVELSKNYWKAESFIREEQNNLKQRLIKKLGMMGI